MSGMRRARETWPDSLSELRARLPRSCVTHSSHGAVMAKLRARRSIKVGSGVKLNLNKKSASVTVGRKGAHYTKSTNGSRTVSAGIPGTGVSVVDRKGPGGQATMGTSSLQHAPRRRLAGGFGFLAGLVVVVLVAYAMHLAIS